MVSLYARKGTRSEMKGPLAGSRPPRPALDQLLPHLTLSEGFEHMGEGEEEEEDASLPLFPAAD